MEMEAQSSVPKAWQEFDSETGRMRDSSLRERVVDVAEEFAKFTAVMAPVAVLTRPALETRTPRPAAPGRHGPHH